MSDNPASVSRSEFTGDVSPFDEAIRLIVREGQLRLACPYISLDYLNQVIDGISWRLLTDIEEWLRNQALAQREKAVEFLSDHRASVRHYRRLHAKVVIGLRTVMFGSANLTNNGIWKRAEVSAIIDDAPQVEELSEWFEGCWFQSQELPSNDAMAEYIKSLPEVAAPVEGDVAKLFPPLSTKPASLAELEGQEATTGEATAQQQAQETEPAPEEDVDDVEFHQVRPSSAVEVVESKRRSSKRGVGKYGFEAGETVSRDRVIAACEKRLAAGGIIREEERAAAVEFIRVGPELLVWCPQTSQGWGASPFNLNNWRTVDGRRITNT